MVTKEIIQSLDNNLVLRSGTPADMDKIAQFNGKIHADDGDDFDKTIADWTRDLGNGTHPTTQPGDFTLVEDTTTGEIVSTLCLIGQTWAYEGIDFPVGRPELVGTLAEYRRRGLVRKQFEVIHEWSAARGQVMQIITGIPWYYRQFGYEMAINLGGNRRGNLANIPKLKEGQEEPFHFRRAKENDLRFIADLYNQSTTRGPISCIRDDAIWRYEFSGRSQEGTMTVEMWIIETPAGEPVGFMFTRPKVYGGKLHIGALELAAGYSWMALAHPLLRQIEVIGKSYAKRESTRKKPVEMTGFSFNLGEDHPIYHLIPKRMPDVSPPYAYYIRVPDLPEFLKRITPVLEDRLAQSYMAGHSGELTLNFFRGGVKMDFENGKIKEITPWQKAVGETPSAHFPDLTFLQLVFGHRDVHQLENAFPDLYYPKEGVKYLLGALFPRKPSKVLSFA